MSEVAFAKPSLLRAGMAVGKVEFREGEGMLEIRMGAIEIASPA